MKKVRMLQSMAGPNESWAAGDERDVEDYIADAWCKPEVGIAVLVSPPKGVTPVETASVNPPRNAAAPAADRKRRGAK